MCLEPLKEPYIVQQVCLFFCFNLSFGLRYKDSNLGALPLRQLEFGEIILSLKLFPVKDKMTSFHVRVKK